MLDPPQIFLLDFNLEKYRTLVKWIESLQKFDAVVDRMVMIDYQGTNLTHIRELQPFFAVYDHVDLEKRGEPPLYAVVQYCMAHLPAFILSIEALDDKELDGLAEITRKIEYWSRAKCDFYDASWTGFLKRIFSCFRNAWVFGKFRSSGEQGLIVMSILRDEIQRRRDADNLEPKEKFDRILDEAFRDFKDKAFDLLQEFNSVGISNLNDSLDVQISPLPSPRESTSESSEDALSQTEILEEVLTKLNFAEYNKPEEICDLLNQLEGDSLKELIKKVGEDKLLEAFWLCESRDAKLSTERLKLVFKFLSEAQFERSIELDAFFLIISNHRTSLAEEVFSAEQLELIASKSHTQTRLFQLSELLNGLSHLNEMIELKTQEGEGINSRKQIESEVSNERLAKLNAIITGIGKIGKAVKQNDEHKIALLNIQRCIGEKAPKNKGNTYPNDLIKRFKEALASEPSLSGHEDLHA